MVSRTSMLTLFLIALVLRYCCLNANFEEESARRMNVHAKDLESKHCSIIGHLGHSYGTIVKIRGHWVRNEDELKTGKGQRYVFVVREIDGKSCESITFHGILVVPIEGTTFHQKHLKDGEEYSGRVYEAGGFVRKPVDVMALLKEPLSADPLKFHYYSFLYLID